MKTQRLRHEMSQAKKDVEFYLTKVDESKDLKRLEERRLAQGDDVHVAEETQKVRSLVLFTVSPGPPLSHLWDERTRAAVPLRHTLQVRRKFRQKDGVAEDTGGDLPPALLGKVLGSSAAPPVPNPRSGNDKKRKTAPATTEDD